MRPAKDSKIPLGPNNGMCCHIAEELFYQKYGIWFGFTNNYTKNWRNLKYSSYRVNGMDYQIKSTKVPTVDTVMFVDNGEDVSHLAWVYNISVGSKGIMVDVIESDWIDGSSPYFYNDCWYRYTTYIVDGFDNISYIYAEITN